MSTPSGRSSFRSRTLLRGLAVICTAAASLLFAAGDTQNAAANGDTRTISIRHMHSKEELTVTFKRDGRYDSAALEKLNWILRDWRTDEPIRMDPRLFDVAWEVQRMTGSNEPFHVVSAYRAPGTNAMLRRRSRAVAKHSQHTLGKAMDFYLPDTPTARIREAGMRLQRGGVGFYPSAHTPFVHLDAGSVRSWPRMTRDQLVRLFPDQKTVHLPADGKPLAGYELAKAEIMSGGGAVAGYATADLDEGAVMSSGRKSLWASLFGGDEEEADARPTRGRRAAPKPQPTVMVYANPYNDSNSADGGRFAVAAATPEPTSRAVTRERSERLVARPVDMPAPAPAPQPVTPPPAAPQQPQFAEAPMPLARPRTLPMPGQPVEAGVQIAALPGAAGALAFAPSGNAAMPPRRPDQIAALLETPSSGQPVDAPFPPSRPTVLASLVAAELRGADTTASLPEGKLVSLTHPLPPSRPALGGASAVAAAPSRPAQSLGQAQIDRSGLEALFATVARTAPASANTVKVATARARPASPAAVPIHGPSPAAALGFSKADPSDAKTGSFSGPAVRALPTSFVQN